MPSLKINFLFSCNLIKNNNNIILKVSTYYMCTMEFLDNGAICNTSLAFEVLCACSVVYVFLR